MARALLVGAPMLQFRWGLLALVLAIALALACAATLLSPPRYLATGGVLMPAGMLRAQYAAPDPQSAAALVQRFIEQHKDPLLVDPPVVVRLAPGTGMDLVALAGCALAFVVLFLLLRGRARAVRSENELIATLGVPMLAARPLAPQALSEQLKAYWFGRGRPVLAVVSAKAGDGGTLRRRASSRASSPPAASPRSSSTPTSARRRCTAPSACATAPGSPTSSKAATRSSRTAARTSRCWWPGARAPIRSSC